MAYVTDGQPEKVDEFAGRYPTVHQTAQNPRHKLWGDDLLYCIHKPGKQSSSVESFSIVWYLFFLLFF